MKLKVYFWNDSRGWFVQGDHWFLAFPTLENAMRWAHLPESVKASSLLNGTARWAR